MGQIVRRKRRGRPSNTDRARINHSAAPPSPVDRRRSRRRRNVRYNFDIDDYVDDDEFYSDEDEEVGRREKKLRLLLSEDDSRRNTRRVRHAPTSSSSSDDYDEDDDFKHSKKRKVNADDREDDEDNEIEEIIRQKFEEEDDEEEEEQQQYEEEEEEAASDHSKLIPLPDKNTLLLILDKLQKKDTYGVYSEPVDPDELPDYHDVIKHPMDFSTVRKKLTKGAYLTLKEFESDVYLICTNAMQYNAPDTVYYKQASSIQEQAKLRFQRLKATNVDRSDIEQQQLNTDYKTTPSFSFSPPKKQLKKPVGRPVHDPIGPETLSGSNVRIEESPVRLNSSEVVIAESCCLPDTSLDKDQELVTGKGFVNKNGMKGVHDENRRATYDTCVEPVAESDSVFTIFEGESKQFIPVGLHVDHSYARSLARFAATLGTVAWKVASQTIEQSLPAGIKYGRGWVGEYEPLPTTVRIMPGDYSLKEASRLNNISLNRNNARKRIENESLKEEEQIKNAKSSFLNFSGSDLSEGPPTPVSRNGSFVSLPSFKQTNSQNDGFAPGRPSQGVGRDQQEIRRMPSFKQTNVQNDGFAHGRGNNGNPTTVVREQQHSGMMSSFRHPNGQNDGFAPARQSQGNQQPGLSDSVRMIPSFKQPNIQNDRFAPGRQSQGNPTPVGREQPPPGMIPSFNHPNGQNDGFTPGRQSQGNPTPVSREQQQQQPGVIPSFRQPNIQNDGFAPGRQSQGNPTPVGREQPPPGMIPSFNQPNGQNDGFAPGRPSQGVGLEQQQEIRRMPSFNQPKVQNDGFAPGRPSQGVGREQQEEIRRIPAFNQPNVQKDGFAPGRPGSEPGLSDPVQMMKMLADRSQSQQNNSKINESGAQAWMSLGGTHKQQIPPPVVDPLNNVRYQPQVTRFRGEVHNTCQQPVPQHVGLGFHPQIVTADLSRFQVQQQSSWRGVGVTPQMQMQRPKQQETCPPDLNIGYQSSPVTGMLVDSQQPDLALQL